ncbi:MAG TPA: hypothetical protein VGH74_11120 [Planctomycetaceae bacterium]|jgi:hypothetical protein
MNFTPEQVDLIVQRVVAQLGPRVVAAPPAAGVQHAAVGDSSPVPAAQIADQVVTQALLADRLNGSNQVRIGFKAILTPSARDFVKQRGIKIIRETAASKSATMRWQVIVTKANPNISSAVASLSELGIAIDQRLSGLPAEAAAQATSALCRGEAAQVVVFTDQPEFVACLANRNDKVRAAAAANVAAIERVCVSMQVNLIAIDPASRNAHEIRGLLKAFRAS